MNNYEIVKIGIDEYDKCSNIWNMKDAPFTADFKNQIIRGERNVYVYKKTESILLPVIWWSIWKIVTISYRIKEFIFRI